MSARLIRMFLFVLIMTGALKLNAQDIFEVEKGYYATRKIDMAVVRLDQRKRLQIRAAEGLRGNITLIGEERSSVSITYSKQARAANRSMAIDYIDLISVSAKELPDRVVLSLKAPNPPPWNSETEAGLIDMNIILPSDFTVDLEATYFSVQTEGRLESLSSTNSLGSFEIEGITGSLTLSTKNQRITLDSITGKINVSTTNATIRASNIFSSSDPAVFTNEGGAIDIEGFAGQLNARNKFGRVAITDFSLYGDANFVRCTSGPVEIKLSGANEGQLVINNRYEDINLTVPDTLAAYFSLSVDEDGKIEVVGLPFTADLIEQDRLNLISGNGTVEIVSSIRGKGNIYVTGIKGD